MSNQFEEFERLSKIIKRIARQYHEDSEEYKALKTAMYSVLFALTQHGDEFKRYRDHLLEPLTDDERKRLKDFGLN